MPPALLKAQQALAKASEAQLSRYELLPDGAGVAWPELDEHLSLRGFLLSTMSRMLTRPVRPSPRRTKRAVA